MRIMGLLLLLLAHTSANASNIDSLRRALGITHGKAERAIILLRILDEYYDAQKGSDTYADSVLTYATAAYHAAKEARNDTLIMQAMYRIGDGWAFKERHDLAIIYFDSVRQYAIKVGDKRRQVISLIGKGRALRDLGRYYEAIDNYEEGITIADEINDKAHLAFLYRTLAVSYGQVEDYANALSMAQISIRLCDSLKDLGNLANNYISVANMLVTQGKFEEGLKYYAVADSVLHLKKDNNTLLAKNTTNMAITCQKMGNYKKAIELLNICLNKYYLNTRYKKHQAKTYCYLGIAHTCNGDLAEAEKCFARAGTMNDSMFHDTAFTGEICFERAKMELRGKKYERALTLAHSSMDIAAKGSATQKELLLGTRLLADIYAGKGDFANAYKYLDNCQVLQDSIDAKRQRMRLADAETRFRMSEKNRELQILSKENEMRKMKGQQQAIALALSALVVFIGAGGYRRSVKKNAQLKKQKQIIDDQLSQLAIASEMRSKFYANMSHELRTPVTLLSGMLELMKNEGDSKRPEKLDIAYNNSRKLQYMVEEILDLSRLEKSETKLNMQTVMLAPLLKRIVYAFESFIEKKGLELAYADDDIMDLHIQVDEHKFEKIVNNLIFNAIKFNKEKGSIAVKAYQAGNTLCIEIKDTGIGISEKDLPHIFERFYQSASGKNAEGVGIGLSLVREFTELLGGKVSVTSTRGQGSLFSLSFPLAQPAASQHATEELSADIPRWQQPLDGYSVLIVEDNSEMRYYLREVLGSKVSVTEAGNGIEALRWLESNTPDLIISDIMMPQMDGEEFVATLKRTDTLKKIPVIMLTALAASDRQVALLRLGVDDYMVKPFNAEELQARVYNLLNNYAARKDFVAQPAEPGDIPAEGPEAEEFRQKVTEFVLGRLKRSDVSVNDLAYELSMSERHLHRTAKSLTGYSPSQLIKEVKLQKAYQLLQSGEINKIDDVARRVGFEKASYFSQQFFERFGKRPSAFL